jgi:hypothetical protein
MKQFLFAATILLTAFGTTVSAGSVAYVEPVEPMIVEPTEPMGSSGAWIIPLIAIGLIALAISQDDDGGAEALTSDMRLKTDIVPVGTADNGLPLYQFRYIGGSQQYIGVMAQDVIMHTPEAIVDGPFGTMLVNYGMLGLEMQKIN